MTFNEILATLPAIDELQGLEVLQGEKVVHYIPAVAGKLGSLKVYNALAEQFHGVLDKTAAEQGLALFAEHTEDAKANVGKHPNIDLLLKIIAEDLQYSLRAIK